MKRFAIFLSLALTANLLVAQQEVKDRYIKSGNMIEATLYHDNGMVAQTGQYNKAGKLHGKWTSYDAQGNKTATAYYNNGAKTGTWFFWVGNDLHEVVYQDSRVAKVSSWESTGVQIVSNQD
jgi:antitoxin component YwqK of YwqJK toxin-antitoxin module